MNKLYNYVFLLLVFTIKMIGQQDTIIYNPGTGNYTIQYTSESFAGEDTIITLTYIPWTKLNPFVKCEVSYDLDSSEYLYNWIIGNGENSEQNLKKFVIVFGENSQVDDRSSLGWYSKRWRGSIDGQVVFLNRWGWTGDQGLEPTWSVGGFKLGSPDLPSIGFAYFQGKGSIPRFPYTPPPDEIESLFVKLDGFPTNYVRLETIVPDELPNPVTPIDFIDTLLNYNQYSLQLDWITNQTIADKYDSLFNTTKTEIQQNNSNAAITTLQSVLQQLDIDSTNYITSEAYALLRYNTEYLVEQLSAGGESISTYSIFATNSVWLQHYSNIISGSVGVNLIGEPPFLTSHVELAVGKGTTTPAGYALKGNRIEIKQNTTVNADVYYNELANNGTITGSLNTPLELPLIAALPEFQSSTPGAEDIVVQQNEERILLPGAYRDIQVKNNAKLIFTGGEYHINNFNGGESNQLLFQANSEVRIKEKFETGKGSYIGPQDTIRFSAKDIVFYIEGNNGSMGATLSAAGVGEDSRVKANFYVPNGTLWLRKNSEAEGAFIGKNVKVGEGTKVKLKSAW